MEALILSALIIGGALSAEESGAAAVDHGKSALRKGSFPWYDAEKDAAKPLFPPKRRPPSNLPAANPGAGSILNILMYVILGIVAGLLIYLVIAALRSHSFEREEPRAKQASSQSDRIEALPTQVRKVDDYIAEAERQFAAGNLGLAIAYLFSHQLIILDRASIIRLAKGKTNRQYLHEVARHAPSLGPTMELSVGIFEESFFGHHPIDRDRFDRFWETRKETDQWLTLSS
ncbi:hypothetical protein Pan216_31150 [Planctomycetes bacterium Pan216]|uniref:Protein-glutamine gamma-glutamyltransferase-like C-terminal domain-containing protein n=1 Tax=Kolteria novifilia TaxID=2527975 RepID=A0A518B5J3_9BACT|nr:hypothetical protein Pan216_31150 [Planctomycetes bacterium Pan216]